MSGARLGRGVILGQNVFVAATAVIGDNVKIQNNVSIYDGVTLEDDVFCGPSCVFTNVANPRAAIVRRGSYVPTLVRRGATIGANATIVCGARLGRWSFVAAGAVVPAREIPDYAFVAGVPAKQRGFMSRHGHRLTRFDTDGIAVCPESGLRYRRQRAADGRLELLCCDDPTDDAEGASAASRLIKQES